MRHIMNWAKGVWLRLSLSRQVNAQVPESEPDQTRRMILAGGAALVLTGLLVPGMTTEAEAQYHSWRRSERRRRHSWRRSERRRHHWRRSRRQRHHWRRSRRHNWRRSRYWGWW